MQSTWGSVEEEQVEQSLSTVTVLDMLALIFPCPTKKKFAILDQVDERATYYSVITIVQKRCHRLTSYNTDGLGSLKSLPRLFSTKKLVLLGAGGA